MTDDPGRATHDRQLRVGDTHKGAKTRGGRRGVEDQHHGVSAQHGQTGDDQFQRPRHRKGHDVASQDAARAQPSGEAVGARHQFAEREGAGTLAHGHAFRVAPGL